MGAGISSARSIATSLEPGGEPDDALDQMLQTLFQAVIDEPPPHRFLELIAQLGAD